MPEKQKARDRKEIPALLAASALTLLLTLWNGFANHDRHRVAAADSSAPESASPAGTTPEVCVTPSPAEGIGARCMTVTRTRSS